MTDHPHFTTRRGFVAAMGFAGTSLYGLWVAYGAAPGPRALLAAGPTGPAAPGAHGGHVGAAAMPAADFEARVRDFVARYAQPDGSVWPRPGSGTDMPAVAGTDHTAHGAAPGAGAAHAGAEAGGPVPPHDDDAAIDVWLLASRFQFEPAHLKLEAGRRYRFRMMAADVAHGASLRLGQGSRMIRLRPGRVTETEMVFSRPGSFLVYCTYYCGVAHDAMQGRLSVIERQEGAA